MTKKLLVISPHPDDEVLGAGGLIAKYNSKGYHVTILDNFLYGYESLLGFVANKKISIIKKDIKSVST